MRSRITSPEVGAWAAANKINANRIKNPEVQNLLTFSGISVLLTDLKFP
jgi:hypothetical protein